MRFSRRAEKVGDPGKSRMVYRSTNVQGCFEHEVSSREGHDLHGAGPCTHKAFLLELYVHELEHDEETIGND